MSRASLLTTTVTLLCLLASPLIGPRSVSAQVAEAVIPSTSSRFFLKATNPAPGTFPGGWRLKDVKIQWVSALVTFTNRAGKLVVVELSHPSSPGTHLASTDRFALTAPDSSAIPSEELILALAQRIRTHESRFAWNRQLRSDAVPIDPMNRPAFQQSKSAAASRLRGAMKDLKEGRSKQAVATALSAARPAASIETLRFAATILRQAGSVSQAMQVLDQALKKAAGTPDEIPVQLDRLASFEAAGDRQAASAVSRDLAARFRQAFPDPRCARADALAILLQAGQIADASRAALEGPEPMVASGDAPLCVHLYQVRAASAAGDADAVEACAKTALEAYPNEPNILFLWGTYFYARNQLERALPPWDRLAAIDPTFPSLMSQYGTAYLVAGRLDAAGIKEQQARLSQKPDDAVAAYLAGLGLYYQREFAQVIPLLEQASKAVPNDPRPKMYLAMAHFFVGRPDVTRLMLDELEPFAYQEPDINYCRSLVFRSFDLPRAIREMATFLRVFEGENRLRFGQQKVDKARKDLQRMRRGEIPEVWLPQPDGQVPDSPKGKR
jgi:tetratricopeptide (TPR) repeat protein